MTDNQGRTPSPRRRRKRRRNSLPASPAEPSVGEPIKTVGGSDENDGTQAKPRSERPRRRRNEALVQLEEDVIVPTNIVGVDPEPENFVIGMALKPVFEHSEGGLTLLKFTPA